MKFLKKIFLQLLALLCAITIWFYVILGKYYEADITVPVSLTKIPSTLAPTHKFPSKAKITVFAKGKDILMLKFSSAKLNIDGKGAKPGNNTFTLNRRNVHISGKINTKILFVKSPTQIEINFDSIIKKKIPIKNTVKISLDNNKTLISEPMLKPSKTTVKGPRKNIIKLDTVSTEDMVVKNVRRDTSFFVQIKKPNIYGIDFIPDKIKIILDIESITKRTVKNIPVKLIGVPDNFPGKLNVKTISLTVAGAKQDVESLKREHINVFVRYSRFAVEQFNEVEPTVSIIGNVQWSNLEPKKVKLIRR